MALVALGTAAAAVRVPVRAVMTVAAAVAVASREAAVRAQVAMGAAAAGTQGPDSAAASWAASSVAVEQEAAGMAPAATALGAEVAMAPEVAAPAEAAMPRHRRTRAAAAAAAARVDANAPERVGAAYGSTLRRSSGATVGADGWLGLQHLHPRCNNKFQKDQKSTRKIKTWLGVPDCNRRNPSSAEGTR